VSVALCDASGCSESDPQWITVFDVAGAHLLDPDEAAAMRMDAIAADLEQRLQAWEAVYGPRETWSAETEYRASTSWTLAKTVGKGLFSGALGKVGGEGMGQLMRLMGYNENPDDGTGQQLEELQSAMNEINQSVNALHDKVDGNARKIDALVNQIDDATGKALWNTFRTNDQSLRRDIYPPIEDLFALINLWTEDNPPTQTQVERYVADVSQAVISVRNGTTGSQGTMAMLMEALDYTQRVNDLEDFWDFVDEYRGEVRAVLAQAIVGLEYMLQFDDSSYTEFQQQASRSRADDTVEAMWSMGLQIPQDEQYRYVGTTGAGWVMASGSRPELSGEHWISNTDQDYIEPKLQALIANYRADLTDKELELWLIDRGIEADYTEFGRNLKVLYADSATYNAYDHSYSFNEGVIFASTYEVRSRRYHRSDFYRLAELYGEPIKFMETPLNIGGRQASFDADAIQGMAFGIELKLEAPEGGSVLSVEGDNPTDAPDARLLDTATGELIAHQGTAMVETYRVSPGDAITIQVGERAESLFGPVGEMTFIVPEDRDVIEVSFR
jgi:hypothetical protein